MSEQQSEYGARAAPADFNEFMAAIGGDGVTIDADLYEEFFGHAPGKGVSPAFVTSLPRPKSNDPNETCPVCLQTLGAIATEEEYALASESFFGDLEALGLRVLPCPAKHVVCGRCASQWLALNNSCPLCRAVVDPSAPQTEDTIEQQRETERMLGLFHALFRRDAPKQPKDTGRDSFAGMYS